MHRRAVALGATLLACAVAPASVSAHPHEPGELYVPWTDSLSEKQWLMSVYGGNEDQRGALEKTFAAMQEAAAGPIVASYALPKDDKTGLVATMLQEAEDPAKLRSAWGQYMSALGEMKTALFTQKITYKPNAEKYKDHSIDVTTTAMTLAEDNEAVTLLKGFYARFFGGDIDPTKLPRADDPPQPGQDNRRWRPPLHFDPRHPSLPVPPPSGHTGIVTSEAHETFNQGGRIDLEPWETPDPEES